MTASNNNALENGKDNKPELSNIVVSKDNTVKPGTSTPAPKPQQQNPKAAAQPHKPIEEKKLPSMAERIKKFEELETILKRRNSLEEHLQNVKTFYISPTGNSHLKLTDSNGKTFGIAHPIVIGEIVAMTKLKLQKELDEIETQFDFNF